ncbi:MAG: hypothetical protein ACJAWS_002091 [Oleiphilaceae bacterium]|jgi:hypothetical protein
MISLECTRHKVAWVWFDVMLLRSHSSGGMPVKGELLL